MASFNSQRNAIQADAEAAVTEYDYHFMEAYAAMPDPWAQDFARVRDTQKVIQRWPVDLSSPGFTKFRGTPKYRTLSEKFFDLEIAVFDDGVEELAKKVADVDFVGFATQPAKMAKEAKRLINKLAASALGAGHTQVCWDGTEFFKASGKPVNPLDPNAGTYGNYFTNLPLNETNLITVLKDIATRKGPNGESLGLMGTHLMVPTDLYETARILIELPLGSGGAGSTNPVFNRLKVVKCDELASGYWYVVHQEMGYEPLVVSTQNGGAPETEVLGVDSHLYKQKGRMVGWHAYMDVAVGLALPWAVTKVKTTA